MMLPPDSPGAHPDSFPTTEPFGFSAATYFVPMCALLGGKFLKRTRLVMSYVGLIISLNRDLHIWFSGHCKFGYW